jgi:peptidoglycan/LPS O-acetylase OafA/YrhL
LLHPAIVSIKHGLKGVTLRTIGEMLDAKRGIGLGFDFLRVVLACLVVVWHVLPIVKGYNPLEEMRILWFNNYWILASFFGLSGFLITGSAQRLRLHDFIINRSLRIVPALAVEIILSAFVLGAVFTALPLNEYFSSSQTYAYLTNIVGLINYHLPGVFSTNPGNVVNAALWTVPYEIGCYVIMSGAIVCGLLKRPILVVVALIVFLLVGLSLTFSGYVGGPGYAPNSWIDATFYNRGSRLYATFLMGILVYLYRHKIPYDFRIAAVALAVCGFVAIAGPTPLLNNPVLNVIAAPAVVYLTAFVGVAPLPKLPLFHHGDYSYGIYLYGYPVQQSLVALFPDIKNPAAQLAMTMVALTAFAAFSWHFIEKPILKLRKNFSFVARQRLEESESTNHSAPAIAQGASTLR